MPEDKCKYCGNPRVAVCEDCGAPVCSNHLLVIEEVDAQEWYRNGKLSWVCTECE